MFRFDPTEPKRGILFETSILYSFCRRLNARSLRNSHARLENNIPYFIKSIPLNFITMSNKNYFLVREPPWENSRQEKRERQLPAVQLGPTPGLLLRRVPIIWPLVVGWQLWVHLAGTLDSRPRRKRRSRTRMTSLYRGKYC